MSIKYLKIGAVAELLGCSESTLRNWEQRGILVPEIVSDTGHRRYSAEQVEKFIEDHCTVV